MEFGKLVEENLKKQTNFQIITNRSFLADIGKDKNIEIKTADKLALCPTKKH